MPGFVPAGQALRGQGLPRHRSLLVSAKTKADGSTGEGVGCRLQSPNATTSAGDLGGLKYIPFHLSLTSYLSSLMLQRNMSRKGIVWKNHLLSNSYKGKAIPVQDLSF